MDVFAREISHRYSDKRITLKDIVDELSKPFQDNRGYVKSPADWQLFNMFTGEVIQAPPGAMELVGVNRNELYFHEHQPLPLTLVEKQIVEVTVRRIEVREGSANPSGFSATYGNNIHGFVHIRDVSDHRIDNLEERVQPGQVVLCRVLGIRPDRFSLNLSCKSSFLRGEADEDRRETVVHPDGRDNFRFTRASWGWDV